MGKKMGQKDPYNSIFAPIFCSQGHMISPLLEVILSGEFPSSLDSLDPDK
jgi:hypothetical protein